MIQLNIPPFLSYVRSEYLFDHKEGEGYFSPATIFSVSISQNEYPKFQVLIDDKTLFSNIPLQAISGSKLAKSLREEDCVYIQSADKDVVACVYDYLLSIEDCFVWQKNGEKFQAAKYIMTLDWYIAKEQLHLLELEDGNYVLWHNSLITWGLDVPEKLPAYGRSEDKKDN